MADSGLGPDHASKSCAAMTKQCSFHCGVKKKKWGEGGNFQRLLRAVTRFELFLKVTLQYLKGYVREVRELADHQSNPGETPGPETKRKQFGLCSR